MLKEKPLRFAPVILMYVASVVLTGCLPAVETYYRLQHDKAIYYRQHDAGRQGPKSLIYFQLDKIHVSAVITDNKVQLGLHIPKGVSVVFIGNKIIVVTHGSYGKREGSYSLRLIPHIQSITSLPYTFLCADDPYEQEDGSGVLTGATASKKLIIGSPRNCDKLYLFSAELTLQQEEVVSIRCPGLVINDVPVEGPVISAKRSRKFFVLAPL